MVQALNWPKITIITPFHGLSHVTVLAVGAVNVYPCWNASAITGARTHSDSSNEIRIG
jgi:hypothetical protein